MYVCKMSCYWAPHINYTYNPPGTMRNTFYKALRRGTDMERHRQNATEKLRDCRQQVDGERRMVAHQQET